MKKTSDPKGPLSPVPITTPVNSDHGKDCSGLSGRLHHILSASKPTSDNDSGMSPRCFFLRKKSKMPNPIPLCETAAAWKQPVPD
jgi:hypothetical protein